MLWMCRNRIYGESRSCPNQLGYSFMEIQNVITYRSCNNRYYCLQFILQEWIKRGGWKTPLGILVLSNLPDVDVVLGIVLQGNGSAFHRGPTHSLIFALIAGFLASKVWELWSPWPRLSFRICFMLILSHILADSVFTSSPISFFWPFVVNWSGGHSGLTHVVNSVLFENYQDMPIILDVDCLSFFIEHLRNLEQSFFKSD